MDGSSGRSLSSAITSAALLFTVATSECVVPRSMPTASLRSCGSGDAPGSEICSSAMSGHARARRAPVEVVATDLPFAPAGIRELDVVLVLAAYRARVDLAPFERVRALQSPAFSRRCAGGEIRRDEGVPQVAQRRIAIGGIRREQAERVRPRDPVQQREI